MASAPYAGQLNYLDFVIPATRAVVSPEITPEGVLRAGSGGDVSTPTTPSSEGLAVGQATAAHQQSGFQHGSPIPGGLVGKGDMAAFTIAASLAGVPSIATTLFSVSNALAGWGTGFNTDPTTGARINSAEFQAIRADPLVNTVINPSVAAISPLAMATVGPIGASQPGFSTSPFALGTPFGMPFTPAQWDATFGTKAREAQEPAPGAGQSETGPAPSTFGVDATSGMANVAKRGGLVRGSLRDRLDDKRYLLQSGEYVIRRASVAKYRTLLDAINRDRPTEVRRLASKLQARLVA